MQAGSIMGCFFFSSVARQPQTSKKAQGHSGLFFLPVHPAGLPKNRTLESIQSIQWIAEEARGETCLQSDYSHQAFSRNVKEKSDFIYEEKPGEHRPAAHKHPGGNDCEVKYEHSNGSFHLQDQCMIHL